MSGEKLGDIFHHEAAIFDPYSLFSLRSGGTQGLDSCLPNFLDFMQSSNDFGFGGSLSQEVFMPVEDCHKACKAEVGNAMTMAANSSVSSSSAEAVGEEDEDKINEKNEEGDKEAKGVYDGVDEDENKAKTV